MKTQIPHTQHSVPSTKPTASKPPHHSQGPFLRQIAQPRRTPKSFTRGSENDVDLVYLIGHPSWRDLMAMTGEEDSEDRGRQAFERRYGGLADV